MLLLKKYPAAAAAAAEYSLRNGKYWNYLGYRLHTYETAVVVKQTV